jgi:ssDNA thymidine ADP-ribosyltransferase, DarT
MTLEVLKSRISQHGIHGLYYFSLISNLDSILNYGILPKNTVERKGIQFEVFANQEVQKRRHWKTYKLKTNKAGNSPGLNHLHSLVPLYFTPRTPTLSAVREIQNDIFFIQVNPHIICSDDVSYCFTDGNAASGRTTCYTEIEDLDKLFWDIIHSVYWNNFVDGTRIRNSEVLIHPQVSTHYFNKLVVNNSQNQNIATEKLAKYNLQIECEINPSYFF